MMSEAQYIWDSQRMSQARAALANLSHAERVRGLEAVVSHLFTNRDAILAANVADVKAAEKSGLAQPLVQRLHFTEEKLQAVVNGLTQLTKVSPPALGREWDFQQITQDLVRHRRTVPLGTILVIFESRPDVLPQLFGLAWMTGNAIIFKGGKEALQTLHFMFQTIQETLCAIDLAETAPAFFLTTDRTWVNETLFQNSASANIDLVIGRGSKQLIQHLQRVSPFPVLGHADGVCHLYAHASFENVRALRRILVDAKCSAPAACNAVETLLIDDGWFPLNANQKNNTTNASSIALREQMEILSTELKVALHFDVKEFPTDWEHLCAGPQQPPSTEFGSRALNIFRVPDPAAAIAHINQFGSHHTDVICAHDPPIKEMFLNQVDSACVFANASTRFADGYRLGLGAEVGISTGRFHARGPVGTEGLLSYKWIVQSSAEHGHHVRDLEPGLGQKQNYIYDFQPLPAPESDRPVKDWEREESEESVNGKVANETTP